MFISHHLIRRYSRIISFLIVVISGLGGCGIPSPIKILYAAADYMPRFCQTILRRYWGPASVYRIFICWNGGGKIRSSLLSLVRQTIFFPSHQKISR